MNSNQLTQRLFLPHPILGERAGVRVFAITLILCALASAQTTAPTTLPTNHNGNNHGITTQPGGGMIFNFRDASIDSVLDELSATAGFIIVKDPTSHPTGRVTLLSKQPVNADQAVSLLNTVLKGLNYAAVRQSRILKIIPIDRAKHANIPVFSGSDPTRIEPTDELITQVIPLRSADAAQLKNDLQPLINPEADFTANASSNALVITDTAANIRRIVEIVSALDTHLASEATVKVFSLTYASASSAAKLINDLFGEQATRGQQGGGGQGGPPFGGFGRFLFGGGGGPGGGGFGGGGPGAGGGGGGQNRGQQNQARQQIHVNASADDRTNILVVTGPTDTLQVIEKVVKEIDANPAADETVFIYHLKNAVSTDMEYTLNVLFNGAAPGNRPAANNSRSGTGLRSTNLGGSSSGAFGSSGFGSGGATGNSRFGGSGGGGGGGAFGGFGTSNYSGGLGNRTGTFGAGTFSSSTLQTASALSGQVTIISDPDTNSILIRTAPKNYERIKQVLDDLDRPVAQVLIKVLIAEVTHSNAIDLGVEFSAINLRANGQGTKGGTNFNLAGQSTGMVVSILESNFTATLRALATQGKVDVLSRPYILASDNQLASITVGQRVPYPLDSRTTDTGQTISNFSYDNVGVLLDVVPHINPDGVVTMDVAPEISALTNQTISVGNGTTAPIFDNRSAQSRVNVRNGQTVVIGGLMEDKKNQDVSKVPILGDIPWLGMLFQRHIDDKSKTELLIFLTPHVAMEPDALKKMSQSELEGTRLTPNAVAPGVFNEHLQGLQRGATSVPTTQP